MKRPVLIIIGALLVIILLAVWVYILFFNEAAPQTEADPNYSFPVGTNTSPELVTEPVVAIDDPKPLQQLTLKPVVGYGEVQRNASSTPEVWYIEAGTGHIYSINLTTGEEVRVSATTLPASQKGDITPNGRYAMIHSGFGASGEFVIGTFSTTSDDLTTGLIDERVTDFVASADNTFLYTVQGDNSTVAKEYDPVTNESSALFTIPFRETRVEWGSTAEATHLIYLKASSKLEGYLYAAKNGAVRRLPVSGFGLTANGVGDDIIYTTQEDNTYRTRILSTYNDHTALMITLLPEKCVAATLSTSTLTCAGSPNNTFDHNQPDDWYAGTTQSSDDLWLVNTESGFLKLLASTENIIGRELDITNLKVNQTDDRLYFTNKTDRTLWVFDSTVTR